MVIPFECLNIRKINLIDIHQLLEKYVYEVIY